MQVIDTGTKSASENMSLDIKLLDNLKAEDEPILHFYDWQKPSLTFGYFIDLKKYLNLAKLKKYGFDFARRPTGGGIVFHTWDLAFSFLMPAKHKYFFEDVLKNYQFVHQIVKKALTALLRELWQQRRLCQNYNNKKVEQKNKIQKPNQIKLNLDKVQMKNPEIIKNTNLKIGFFLQNVLTPSFCMARPSKYDLILQNKKAAGAAQRKKQNGYLHQGTIALVSPDEKLLSELFLDSNLKENVLLNSFFLSDNQKDLKKMRNKLQKNLKKQFLQVL